MAAWIPRRFRAAAEVDEPAEPSWLRRQVTATLQDISRRACAHPIHTIVGIALLASTTYVGLLEGSIFDTFRLPGGTSDQLDTSSFLYGSRTLRLGEPTAWRWQSDDGTSAASGDVSVIFTFPDISHFNCNSIDCPTSRSIYFYLLRRLQLEHPHRRRYLSTG